MKIQPVPISFRCDSFYQEGAVALFVACFGFAPDSVRRTPDSGRSVAKAISNGVSFRASTGWDGKAFIQIGSRKIEDWSCQRLIYRWGKENGLSDSEVYKCLMRLFHAQHALIQKSRKPAR